MKRNWNLITLSVILVICNLQLLHAADNITQKPEPFESKDTAKSSAVITNTSETTTTTKVSFIIVLIKCYFSNITFVKVLKNNEYF